MEKEEKEERGFSRDGLMRLDGKEREGGVGRQYSTVQARQSTRWMVPMSAAASLVPSDTLALTSTLSCTTSACQRERWLRCW